VRDLLVYGYGNPGRRDDGLGPLLASMIESDYKDDDRVSVDSNYQLNIEDACEVAMHRAVVFVDAALEGNRPFEFYEIGPSNKIEFSTHSISPESVLAICGDIYGGTVKAYMLAIRGYDWEIGEELSGSALENMRAAYDFLKGKIPEIFKELNVVRAQ
jgi:hydrogenase maturation protease